jgi:hypothetical protein
MLEASFHRLIVRCREAASKDTPGGANDGVSWTILRDAMLCIAPRDEVVGFGAIPNLYLGIYALERGLHPRRRVILSRAPSPAWVGGSFGEVPAAASVS